MMPGCYHCLPISFVAVLQENEALLKHAVQSKGTDNTFNRHLKVLSVHDGRLRGLSEPRHLNVTTKLIE